MYFHIDEDVGVYITGWLITDNPGEVPELIVKVPGRDDFTLSANFHRPDLRDLGMHATGQAGFLIDHRHFSDLSAIRELSIVEPESGLVIYRRFDPHTHLPKKLLLMDASALPQIAMLRQVMTFFAQAYPLAERLSLETVNGLISLTNIQSIFLSGGVNWVRHGGMAKERGFSTAFLLRDPFEEMAEKLLFLSQAMKQPELVRNSAAVARFSSVFPFLEGIDLEENRSILSAFRKMPGDVRKILRSPMTSLLGTAPDEQLQRRNVSIALDNLAQLDVVGTRDRFSLFSSMLDEVMDAPLLANSETSSLPAAAGLAGRLRSVGIIEDILDEDIALYSFVEEALEAVAPKLDEAAAK